MTDWSPLRAELAQWRREDRRPGLWWRDDDAIEPTVALDRLANSSSRAGVPVQLAIIPKRATTDLAELLRGNVQFAPVVHGWSHRNTAPVDQKKSEFGHMHKTARQDLSTGLARMQALFGDAVRPVFVPPWNRLDTQFVPYLAELGYRGISTFGPPRGDSALPFVNTSIDPIAWRSTRSLVDPEQLIAQTVDLLSARRQSGEAASLGLLTHHLVHDAAIWDFCDRFMAELRDGGARAHAPTPFEERFDEQT